jgi:hypothetical protein
METIEKALNVLSQTNMVRLREIEALCQIAQETSSDLLQLECIKRIGENAVVLRKNAAYIYADAYNGQKEGEMENISIVLDAMLGLRNDNTQTLNDILSEYVGLD